MGVDMASRVTLTQSSLRAGA